jgi:hypothetical protein
MGRITVIEHSRKHGRFDSRWPPRRQVTDSRPRVASRNEGVEGDAFLLRALATWEAEGGATGCARDARTQTTA